MKDLRVALRTLLLSDPTVNSLVGGTRVHPVQFPQGQTEPSLVYNRATETEDYHLQGPSGLNQTRIQLDAWAQTTDQANTLGSAAHDVLDGFRGIVASVEMLFSQVVFARDDYDTVAKMFRMQRDYLVWYRMF